MRVFAAILALFLAIPAAHAKGACGAVYDEVAGPLAIVKGMADYKAAMDAGYAACMVNYPQEFAPMRESGDFMQENMKAEMDQAQAVLDRLIAETDSGACVKDVTEEIHGFIGGQYDKAYARRHRIMSEAGLVEREQDSCLIVLDMVRKYHEHYSDYKQLEHVLYESSKKQTESAVGKKSYKEFEKVRAAVAQD